MSSLLAGCIDGDTVEGPVTDDPSVFAVPFPDDPANVQLNPWAGRYPVGVGTLFFESLTLEDPAGHHYPTDVVQDVEIAGRTATVSYAEGYSWWSGDPVTARDRWVAERIQSFVGSAGVQPRPDDPGTPGDATDTTPRPAGAGVTSVALDGEYTIEYEFERALARPIVLDRVLGSPHNVAAWRFQEWLERLSDASTDQEVEAMIAGLRRDRIPLESAMDEGYGCGPYELVEVSVNRLVMDPDPDHPTADSLDVPRIWLPVARSQQTATLISDGVIDGSAGLLGERTPDPASNLEQLVRYDSHGGTKLVCNWNNPHLARPNVRRALLCLIPVAEVASIGGWGEPTTVQTGLTLPPQRRWLESSLVDSLHRYPVESDEAAAAEFMRAAGYERDGDAWVHDDGRSAAFRLRTPTDPDWSAPVRRLSGVFESFGFEVEYRDNPSSTFVADLLDGNFGLAPWVHDGRPRRAYAVTDVDATTYGRGLDGTGGASRYGKRTDVTTPASPGAVRADADDREPLDLLALWNRIRSPASTADARAAVAEFATWWNADVPDILLGTTRTGVWGNVRDFEWPRPDDPGYRRSGPGNRPDLTLLEDGSIRPTSRDA